MKKNGAVYFAAVGGAGALLSKCIKSAEVIAYDEDVEKVPTGYFELDAILGGGLQKGNVGLLAAHTGAGFLCSF